MVWFRDLRELLGLPPGGKGLCMIVSEQEGAEIWIEGRKTSYRTPHLVSLPKGRPVEVTIKQIGHYPWTASLQSSENLSYHYCDLQRIPLRVIHNDQQKNAAL